MSNHMQNLVYDAVGNLTSFTDGQGAVSYGYDAGQRAGQRERTGRGLHHQPRGELHPLRITATGPGATGAGTGTVFSDLGYGYTAGTSDRTVVQDP